MPVRKFNSLTIFNEIGQLLMVVRDIYMTPDKNYYVNGNCFFLMKEEFIQKQMLSVHIISIFWNSGISIINEVITIRNIIWKTFFKPF